MQSVLPGIMFVLLSRCRILVAANEICISITQTTKQKCAERTLVLYLRPINISTNGFAVLGLLHVANYSEYNKRLLVVNNMLS